MAKRIKKRDKLLTPKMLMNKVGKSIDRQGKLNFLESYAMFMGKAQLIEFALKKILAKRYRYGQKKLEKMTLGGAIVELERLGMRKDFVLLLKNLNKFRTNMAHEFLADYLHMVFMDRRFGRLSSKPLQHAIWRVEETTHVFDFLNQNRMLYQRQRKPY